MVNLKNMTYAKVTNLKNNPRYALPYAAPHVAYAHAPLVYNALDTGLVYPVAEAYVHDPTGERR